jgi:pectate lyase
VPGGWADNGLILDQYDCLNVNNQKWSFSVGVSGTDWVKIRSVATGKCADVAEGGTGAGYYIHQWDCISGQANQDWVQNP